jgi:hypothetical protein
MAGEDMLKFIWKHRLFKGSPLHTTCGLELRVIHPGEHNAHAGPDFFNARIRLGALTWAGNVEVHQAASDWYRHGHHIDPAYNNVILHVVGKHDADISNSLGRRIHALVPDYPASLVHRYLTLKKNEDQLPCRSYLKEIPSPRFKSWLTALQADRTRLKSRYLLDRYLARYNREEAFYLALAMGFGLPLNILPFELLAKAIPYRQMLNYRDNLFDLEALWFGQSGLLYPARGQGPYPESLCERFAELKTRPLTDPVPHHLWKFLRLRPASFPTLRISQYASILHRNIPFTDSLLSVASLTELEQLLRTRASEYWDTHYVFGKGSPSCPKYMGQQSVATLIINVIIPFLHGLATIEPSRNYKILADDIFSAMTAESNQVILKLRQIGLNAKNARETQALLQLYNVFCKQKRCFDCQIGAGIVQATLYEKK